jgi:hypothetical protein
MQKLKIITILFLSISLHSFSQDTKKIKQEITNLFAKADKNNLQNILSFEIKDKTGLFDATTNKTILEANKNLYIGKLFNPNMEGSYKGYDFIITQKFEITVIKPEEPNPDLVPTITEYKGSTDYEEPVAVNDNDFKGFTVNEHGRLLKYSNTYVRGNGIPAVSPFKYKGKYYGVTGKKTENNAIKYGIIDTDGNTMPHFDFIYDKIYQNYMASTEDDFWFAINAEDSKSCEKLLEQSFYMNMNGEVKIKGELADYPGIGDCFGLDANASNCLTFTGVFDVTNIKWIIKPQTKIKIRWLDYTSKEVLNSNESEGRSKATIYVRIYEDNLTYYMDLDLKNKYLPTKYKS